MTVTVNVTVTVTECDSVPSDDDSLQSRIMVKFFDASGPWPARVALGIACGLEIWLPYPPPPSHCNVNAWHAEGIGIPVTSIRR